MRPMAPKKHHLPLSGGDRKALTKELAKARVMTGIFAKRSAELRERGEALIKEADTRAQAAKEQYAKANWTRAA